MRTGASGNCAARLLPVTKPNTSRPDPCRRTPRLTANTADDTDLLAELEGWHDFAAHYPEVRGTLYVDYLTGEDRHQTRLLSAGQGPAVPPVTRHNAVEEAKAKGSTKEARTEVRHACIPPELKELAVQRVVADAVNPPPQTIKLSRQQIDDKFPKPAFHVDIQELSNDDRDLALKVDNLAQWLRGMGFAVLPTPPTVRPTSPAG